jgi:hypothetical protein
MPIPFTQFMRPSGRPVQTHIEMPKDIEEKADKLIDLGFIFESEVLQTGEISVTCTNEDGVGSHELCKNGPDVIEAVKKLVETVYEHEMRG